MDGNQIRQAFIDYFTERGHTRVRSSSSVSHGDPTILFTNAGMNQFKDYFLGNEIPPYSRAVTAQKVIRAGGKHNDLENVGRTDRHHTFFEMLGNFSFGDYFKEEAITYAWDFLTRVLGIDASRLSISVFEDDQESYDLWQRITGVGDDDIARLGAKDNFWEMGDLGPCGPCSEIHFRLYDLPAGKTPRRCLEEDDGTYLEIWNLVFMQFDRGADGSMTPLPKPSIDTGMGLERIAAVMQQKLSNYDTNLFGELIECICQRQGYTYTSHAEKDVSCRVIADHIRASSVLIADGVLPSNEGRGYVLRRIIRRAARHARNLGAEAGFFAELSADFCQMFGSTYPELLENQVHIHKVLGTEEQRFRITLQRGMKMLEEIVEKAQHGVSGEQIFQLYDTYGFPVDLAQDVLEDHNLSFEQADFDRAMQEQRKRAQDDRKGKDGYQQVAQVYVDLVKALKDGGKTLEFSGYSELQGAAKLLYLLKDGAPTEDISVGDQVEMVFDRSPFYAEGGGQVGDSGTLQSQQFSARILDTQIPTADLRVCSAQITGTTAPSVALHLPLSVELVVDAQRRRRIEHNHTATHLLHAALRSVLGDHVKQAGSLVQEQRLRFDFNHYSPLSTDEIARIEQEVNARIRENHPLVEQQMSFAEALDAGAMAIFGEKYGDRVRLIQFGESKELCGGAHTASSGTIGMFTIASEAAVAAGIRRIEALTGERALAYMQEQKRALNTLAARLKAPASGVVERVVALEDKLKTLEQENQTLQHQLLAQKTSADLAVEQVAGIACVFESIDQGVNPQQYSKLCLEKISNGEQVGSGILLLDQTLGEKTSLILAVSADLQQQGYAANRLILPLAQAIGGRGGGKPGFARCGGSTPNSIESVRDVLRETLRG